MNETEKGQIWQEWARKWGNIKPTLAFALPDKRDTGQIIIPKIRRVRPAPAHTDCRARHCGPASAQRAHADLRRSSQQPSRCSTGGGDLVTNLSAYQLFDCSSKYEVFPFQPSQFHVPKNIFITTLMHYVFCLANKMHRNDRKCSLWLVEMVKMPA